MPSQRPFFLSSFIAAFRQQGPAIQPNPQQPTKHNAQSSNNTGTAAAAATAYQQATASRSISTTAAPSSSSHQHHPRSSTTGVAIHSPRGTAPNGSSAIPIPYSASPGGGRRRGSDSSSEGFRDAIGADKWYIGGRTATGEEKFFKLGVVRRVRSNDRLSLDRLSL